MPTMSDRLDTEKRDPISSDTGVKAAPPGEHPVTGAVGLFLRVRATKKNALTRRWIVRVTIDGRRRKFGLGSYPTVGLARARQLAQGAHSDVAEEKEPGVRAKRRRRLAEDARTLTLGAAIDGWLANAARTYKNTKSDRIRERALRVHFAPLHSHDVASIKAADVAEILRSLAPETASKAHSAIRTVFDYAAATLEPHSVVIVNPADPRRLQPLGWAPKSRSESKPHPAVHWRVVPSVVGELTQMDAVDAACLLFIIATGIRSKTARLTKWDNIDFGERTWTPPFADLKDGKHHKRPFIVPLNDVAFGVLERMRAGSSSRFVFANSAGGPIGENAITCLVRKLRRRHDDWRDPHGDKKLFTVHGFRSALRTFAEDTRRADSALAELSLGHKVYGEVAARYVRTGLVEERRALLDSWSRHLRGETDNVITLRRGQ
jgi:integrase